jgi:hypothetical protein
LGGSFLVSQWTIEIYNPDKVTLFEPLMNTVSMVMHADWSVNPKKRVVSCARLEDNGRFRIYAPQMVGEITTLLQRIKNGLENNTCAFVGFDFPIGLPLRYAQRSGIHDFIEVLPRLGKGEWHEFYLVAEKPEEISIRRPFYPNKPGGSRYTHLIQAIGVDNSDDLRRLCDRSTSTRRAAAPLFWTIGAQQVGKAAISGWRDLLAPGLENESLGIAIWPFHGSFEASVSDYRIIIAETYPAEFYGHLDIPFGKHKEGGKLSRTARAQRGKMLRKWAQDNQVELDAAISTQLDEGFDSSAFNDDGFDSFIGVAGMLNILLSKRDPGAPDSTVIRKTEGWIFGQTFI